MGVFGPYPSVPLSHVAGGALALAADVVAQASVPTRALLRTVDPEGPERTRLGADGALRRDVASGVDEEREVAMATAAGSKQRF